MLPIFIVAPAYTPNAKPAAPLTRVTRWGDVPLEEIERIRPSTPTKPLPSHFKRRIRGANTPTISPSRFNTPAQRDAFERRKALVKQRNMDRLTRRKAPVPMRTGHSRRINTSRLAAIAQLLTEALEMASENKPVSTDEEVEDERTRRREKSKTCISRFLLIHQSFMQTFDFQAAVHNAGILTDDSAWRQSKVKFSRRN